LSCAPSGFAVFQSTLDIGKALCTALKLDDIFFAGADLSGPNFDHLTPVKDLSAGRPILVISRYAIYSFYKAAEYESLFDYLIRNLGVAASIYLERTGRFTPTFAEIQKQAWFELEIPKKHRGAAFFRRRPSLSLYFVAHAGSISCCSSSGIHRPTMGGNRTMDTPAATAQDYRKRAAELRARVGDARSGIGRAVLLEAARSWDDQADRCEAEAAASRGLIAA
jgi:hypothetical protein